MCFAAVHGPTALQLVDGVSMILQLRMLRPPWNLELSTLRREGYA
jgi:hypothetical protein